MLLAAYPVGSLYLTTNEINPGTLFGGTWEKLTGDAYLKIVTSNPGQYAGTSSEHKIPINSMPAHKHAASGTTAAITKYQYVSSGDGFSVVTGSGGGRYLISSMDNTGGGNAYYPYYYGVYCWRRIA